MSFDCQLIQIIYPVSVYLNLIFFYFLFIFPSKSCFLISFLHTYYYHISFLPIQSVSTFTKCNFNQQVQMGCCVSNNDQRQNIKSSFQQAWTTFQATTFMRADRFAQNRQRIFHFLYLSVAIPLREQTKNKLARFASTLPRNDQRFVQVNKEITALGAHVDELKKQSMQLYNELSKIQSEIIAEGIQKPNIAQVEAIKRREKQGMIQMNQRESEDERQSQKPLKQSPQRLRQKSQSRHSHNEGPRQRENSSFIRQSANDIPQPDIRSSFNTYSVPLSIIRSDIDQIDIKQTQNTDYAKYSKDKLIQKLEFEMDRVEDLEQEVRKISTQIAMLNSDIEDLSKNRKDLLDQLQIKEKFCKNNQKMLAQAEARYMQKINDLMRDKDELEDKVKELHLQIQQYRSEVSRLDRQRQQAISENIYLQGKVKDLSQTLSTTISHPTHIEDSYNNLSMNVLNSHDFPQQRHARLAINRSLQEIIQPTLHSFQQQQSKNKKHEPSFIIVEDQTEGESQSKENNYAILFNHFPNSKILPTHLDFQNAVGTRVLISQMFDQKLLRSELLYSFDPISPNHFSKYIQKRENLLILIQLPNDITLGAFSGTFAPDNQITSSLIFSLDPHRQPIKLIPSRRIQRIDLDPSYLIFGNGQLKIKARTLQLACNIGSFQSIYSWGKRAVPIEKFLGGKQRSMIMLGYEIYQVHFDVAL